jgi:hypothetical protein
VRPYLKKKKKKNHQKKGCWNSSRCRSEFKPQYHKTKKRKRKKRAESVAQVLAHLPCKLKALSSNPSTEEKQKVNKRKEERSPAIK